MTLQKGDYRTRNNCIVTVTRVYDGIVAIGYYGAKQLAWRPDGKYCHAERENEWDIVAHWRA